MIEPVPKVPKEKMLKPKQIEFLYTDFPLYQYDEYTNLVINHGYPIEIEEESEKAVLSRWEITLDGIKHKTGLVWIPKSLLKIDRE